MRYERIDTLAKGLDAPRSALVRRCVLELADALFKGMEAAFGFFLPDAGLGGQFTHDFELFPADDLQGIEYFVHAVTDNGVNFLAHARQSGNGTTRHTGKVIKEAWSVSHGRVLHSIRDTQALCALRISSSAYEPIKDKGWRAQMFQSNFISIPAQGAVNGGKGLRSRPFRCGFPLTGGDSVPII
jgi:hypothetical protein